MTTLTPDQDREHAEAERRKAVALFRYGVIADLIHAERGQRGLYAKMRERAAQDWEIPGTLRRKLGAETIRGWLSDYRRGGFDALLPKVRRDAGCARAIPQAVADLLCEAKEQHPDYSVTLVIDHVKKASPLPEGLVLAPSTVHRVLSLAGLMEKKRGSRRRKTGAAFLSRWPVSCG